jgi:hypothetical protein
MASISPIIETNVAELNPNGRVGPIADHLSALKAQVARFTPSDADIHFTFDHRLRIHVDVRSMEDALAVQSAIEAFGVGNFRDVSRSSVPCHAFRRRVSAVIV